MRSWLGVMAVMAVGSTGAHASPLDVFGFTSRHAAQANTGIGGADDGAALYFNPGGLAVAPGGEILVGTLASWSHLAAGTRIARFAHPFGFQLAGRSRVGRRVALGLGAHLLPRDISQVRVRLPDEPFYPAYGDRLSRIVVLPGAAVDLGHGVTVGASGNVLRTIRAIAGVTWKATPGVRLGIVYRQRFEVPFEATRGDQVLRGAAHFSPHQVGAGVVYKSGSLLASLDAQWAQWSRYPGAFTRPDVPYRDTISIRAGFDDDGRDGIIFRGGYAFETAAMPARQTGVTNLLDGSRHVLATGLGYAWPNLRVDVHAQLHVVSTRTLTKELWDGEDPFDASTAVRDETATGYPSLKSGGEAISVGVALSYMWRE